MKPKAHLFVVDNDTLPVHIQKGFCGIIRTREGGSARSGQIADIMNIRVGDLVFFYMMKKNDCFFVVPPGFNDLEQGYYGIFRVTQPPFSSEEEVRGDPPLNNYFIFGSETNANYQRFQMVRTVRGTATPSTPPILFYRIAIEPVESFDDFKKRFVDDNHAYIDKTDEGSLWTLLFKKIKRFGEERSITPILPEEASKIARLIFKQKIENINFPLIPSGTPYQPIASQPIDVILESNSAGELSLESMLEAYILRALNNGQSLGVLSDIIGDLEGVEFCGNQIQYGISGNKVDILLLHRKELGGSTSYRHRATVIELKKTSLNADSVLQIEDYQKWIAQLATNNDLKAIQPILIGRKMSSHLRESTKKVIRDSLGRINRLGISSPRFIEYQLVRDGENNITGIDFAEFDIDTILSP